MSQTDDIYLHLYSHGSITAYQSLRLYGCMRLAARIRELRKEGHHIITLMIEDKGKRYAKYIFEKDNSIS